MSHVVPTWDLCLSNAPQLLSVDGPRSDDDRRSEAPAGPTCWTICFYKSEGLLEIGDAALEVTPGSVGLIPPDVHAAYTRQGRAEPLSARFALRVSSGESMSIDALQDLSCDFTPLFERFEHAVQVFQSRPAQAEARLWDILWELSERTSRKERRMSRRHVALERACRVIQARISEPLSLSDLATPAGVSPAHLTRLFRAETGLTATDYLRRCRMERALHLLTRSDVPIKEVACEVGIPDLHAFNKAVRRGYGISPRELRSRGLASLPSFVPTARDLQQGVPDAHAASEGLSGTP